MRGKTILLVEDNDDDARLMIRALQRNGIPAEVVVARDGGEALDYLFRTGVHAGRDPAAAPQVVLLDLNLPRVSGFQVLERIRADERTRLLPVVVLTTSGEETDLTRSHRLGANGFVRKPVSFEEFTEAVRELGRYWLALGGRPGPPAA